MSFTKEINMLNITGIIVVSVMCIFLSSFFLCNSATKNSNDIRSVLKEERLNQLKDQISNAYSVIETSKFYEDAQKAVSEMRFGDRKQNSFYVIDGDGMFFVNAANPEFVGKVKLDHKDADGIEYIKKITETAKEKGDGFITYREKQNGSHEPLNKMACFKYFRNWNWIVFAAINTGDIDEKASLIEKRISSDLYSHIFYIFLVVASVSACVIYASIRIVFRRIVVPIRELAAAAENMSMGIFTEGVSVRSNREIRQLADSFERLRASLSIAMQKLKETQAQRQDSDMDMAG